LSFLQKPNSADSGVRHVALLIETSNEYARGILRGIRAFIQEHKPWSIYMGEHSRNQTDLSWLTSWKGDGIIARIENQEIADYVRRLGVPAIDLSAFRYLPELPCIETDDRSIAGLAFDHLLERGFSRFAFCGDAHFVWSMQRKRYFSELAEHMGYSCSHYMLDSGQTWNEERQAMAEWLRSLPKPIGIMTAYDILGQKLLESCQLASIGVPDEVGIIGVDNDELLCNLSSPSLSSVMPNSRETGYRAAETLDRMMSGEKVEVEIKSIPALDVVMRMSTDVVAVKDRVVADAVRLIRSRVYEDVRIDSLLRAFPFSRRALEERFHRAIGRSPHDVMMDMKCKVIKQFLLETDVPLARIAERVGFKHTEYMSVLFKRETGMTPSEYRKSARQ
jgi:LacI family transcriptional regulator